MDERTTGAVVVGVDGASAMPQAVRWAAEEANRRGRPLRLVHATDELSLNYPHVMPTSEDLRGVLRVRGQRLLRTARDAAREAAPGIEPELVLGREGPAATLLEASRTATLLVLATPGLRPLGRFVAGSVSIALAAHASCPVALVRGHVAEDAPPTDGPVVVGIDGSPASEEAVAAAFEEASWRNAPLVAVHTWDDAFLATVFEETHWPLDQSAIDEREREVLGERLAGWQEKYPDVAVERVVTRGRPASALLDLADGAQLIVVGSRGRGGFAGMLLGSTSQAVMSYALCPVLVARHQG